MDDQTIDFEDGWAIIESRGFRPLALVLENDGNFRRRHGFHGPKEWKLIYTTVYKMCMQKKPHSMKKNSTSASRTP